MGDANGPADIAAALERCLAAARHVVLAVSGGADSTALMLLVADWRRARGDRAPAVSVATVDHGLRAESAAEASAVATAAGALQLRHATLHWQGAKPASGLQAAAREARYRLLMAHARALGADVIATAHTEDDQAETLLMRLARGSGIDGLAAIAALSDLGDGIRLARPLIGVPRARLVAYLRARGVPWIEDPGNDAVAFERTRWRRAQATLDELGLTRGQVATSARRLRRAAEALDTMVGQAIASAGADQLALHALGHVTLDWDWLLGYPPEIRLRVLGRIIRAAGGGAAAPSLAQLEAMTEGQAWAPPSGRTLSGAMFMAGPCGRLWVVREPGRVAAAPSLLLNPGETALWDRRFRVGLAASVGEPLRIAPLGPDGLSRIETRDGRRPPGVPARALWALPAFWEGDRLVACPLLEAYATGAKSTHFHCKLEMTGLTAPSPPGQQSLLAGGAETLSKG